MVTVQDLAGYLAAGSNGINHGKRAFLILTTLSLCPQPTFHVVGITTDGGVKLLTVKMGCARVISISRMLSLVTLVSLLLNLTFARKIGIQINL